MTIPNLLLQGLMSSYVYPLKDSHYYKSLFPHDYYEVSCEGHIHLNESPFLVNLGLWKIL